MTKTDRAIMIILFLLVLFFGYKAYDTGVLLANANNTIDDLTKEKAELVVELAKAKNDYMELQSSQNSTTKIEYVEKESDNDGDFEINKKPPKVVVNAGDGTSYEFTPDLNSYQSIQNGKVVVTEDNTLTLDIEKIVDARFKDKVDALEAKHELEMNEKQSELDKVNDKLKITKKQRDFYGAAFATTLGGTLIIGTTKNI